MKPWFQKRPVVTVAVVTATPAEAARILSQHAKACRERKDAVTAALRADNKAGRVRPMAERVKSA